MNFHFLMYFIYIRGYMKFKKELVYAVCSVSEQSLIRSMMFGERSYCTMFDRRMTTSEKHHKNYS